METETTIMGKSESLGKTEINANITIKTEIDDENIRVKAFLNKPSLVKNSEIIKTMKST